MPTSLTAPDSLIHAFHELWDAFPGPVRLIDKYHHIHAANDAAAAKGFLPNTICARVGNPSIHRGCLFSKTQKEKKAHTDRPSPQSMRGWVPIAGYPDFYIHFTISVPDIQE